MKKLCKEIFILLGTFLIFVVFIEFRLRNVQSPIDTLLSKQSENYSADIVVIGNSHTGVLIDAEDSVFTKQSLNFSLSNLELDDRYKVLKLAVKTGYIKTVILGMDADQLGHVSSSNIYDMQLKKYGMPLSANSLGNRVLSNLNFFRLHLGFKELLQAIVGGANRENFTVNFIPFTNKQKNDTNACLKRAQEHSLYGFKNENVINNLSILQRIINLCKEKNIQLLLLQTPKSACYSSGYSNTNIQTALLKIDSVSSIHKVRFLNYFDNQMFTEDDFTDYDHLNKKGSNKLVNMIKRDIDSD